MANKGKVVGLIVVILIAVGFMIQRAMKSNKGGTVETYTQILVDVKANKVFAKPVKIGAEGPLEKVEFPASSPYSEGQNAYPAYQCSKCQTIFAMYAKPIAQGAAPNMTSGMASMPKCPSCGSAEFGMAKLPEGQTSMDVPGPVKIVETQ